MLGEVVVAARILDAMKGRGSLASGGSCQHLDIKV